MIFLERKGVFSSYTQKSDTPSNEMVKAKIGLRYKTRQKFSNRGKTSLIQWIIDHIRELYILITQNGLLGTIRYLNYVTKPKVIYVDALILEDHNSANTKVNFRDGIPLKLYYTKEEIQKKAINFELESTETAIEYELEVLSQVSKKISFQTSSKRHKSKDNLWMVVGTGNFAASVLVPSIMATGGNIVSCCSNMSLSAQFMASCFNIEKVSKNIDEMISENPEVNNILIASPPNFHPLHLQTAISAGLKVYCEKPVAVNQSSLKTLENISHYSNCMIGFNRRFSPAIESLKNSGSFKSSSKRKSITYIVNLGEFSVSMATKSLGGGTTVGSCCHYLDILEYVSDSQILDFEIFRKEDKNDELVYGGSFNCIFRMKNGSIATLVFERSLKPSNGIKEYISIIGDDLNASVSDFDYLRINGQEKRFFMHNKGWKNAMHHFHKHESLDLSTKTPTLLDGIRISKIAMEMDQKMGLI